MKVKIKLKTEEAEFLVSLLEWFSRYQEQSSGAVYDSWREYKDSNLFTVELHEYDITDLINHIRSAR